MPRQPKKRVSPEDEKAGRRVTDSRAYQKRLLLDEVAACTTCKSNAETIALEHESNKQLERLLGTHSFSKSFEWPNVVDCFWIDTIVTASLFPTGVIPEEIADDRLFRQLLNDPVEVRILRIPHQHFSPGAIKSVTGGKIPRDYPFDRNTMLSSPQDGTIGLCILETASDANQKSDFVFLSPAYVKNDDTVGMVIIETERIKDMVKGKRQGPASGFYLLPHSILDTESSSLSKVTQNDRVFDRGPNQNSTGNTVRYSNWQNERKSITAYRDQNMQRFDHSSKTKEALTASCYRHLLIKEMMSRMQAIVVAIILDLAPAAEEYNVWNALIIAIAQIDETSEKWMEIDETLTQWEIILLEWATSTGEMRNHEACHAHTDGNKSHFLETMWLGGKVHTNNTRSSTKIVDEMTNGKLALPFQGIVFDIRCGRDFLHLALTETIHAADETRDRCNWSRVHGP